MSFSRDVKEELLRHYTKARHCQMAELAALKIFGEKNLEFDPLKEIYNYNFTSGKKTFNINLHFDSSPKKRTEKTCCQRAFLRGAFLGAGTISDPEKEYRFDIVCTGQETAEFLQNLLSGFGIRARITKRRGRQVLYLKEAEQISEALNVMEAHKAMMEFENVRILKEMRSSVNRQVNCETANINKAVNASMKQVEDIKCIESEIGLDKLDENLADVAKARLLYPDVTLSELGSLMTPPISKSAVNHRMRKITRLAEEVRNHEKGEI